MNSALFDKPSTHYGSSTIGIKIRELILKKPHRHYKNLLNVDENPIRKSLPNFLFVEMNQIETDRENTLLPF
jgi:hypothetical protein